MKQFANNYINYLNYANYYSAHQWKFHLTAAEPDAHFIEGNKWQTNARPK